MARKVGHRGVMDCVAVLRTRMHPAIPSVKFLPVDYVLICYVQTDHRRVWELSVWNE